MTYKAVHIGQPNYINELIQPYQPVRTLRSSSTTTSALLVCLLDLTLLLRLCVMRYINLRLTYLLTV